MELQSFLGCINCDRVFIPSLATIVALLTDILKKGMPWNWNKQFEDAFDQSKRALMSAQLLAHYNPQKEIILTVDARTTGEGQLYLTNLLKGTDQLHMHPEY